MRVTIEYGYRPGGKVIEEGNFICPLCSRKREYKRIKLQKKVFVGVLSLFPIGDIGEYVRCESCLQSFPPKVLDSGLQIKMKIEDISLPPANIMEIWQKAYDDLHCEVLITGRTDIVETVSPYLLTMASNMQKVGVKFKLEEYEEARKYLYSILNLGYEWENVNTRLKVNPEERTPKQHKKIMEHMEYCHALLSRLP